VASAILFFARGAAAEPSAADIMTKSEEARRVRDISSDATVATGGDGAVKTKSFTWWRKLDGGGKYFRTLTRFMSPAEVRGESILFEEHASANDVLLYLPTFKKIRRVESQAQGSTFMGTVFSYSDIAEFHADDYKHSLKKTEPCPNDKAVQCYLVESIPVSEDVRDRTGYSRQTHWVRADNFMPAVGELYDKENRLWKRMTASAIREVDPVGHKFLAHEVRMDDLLSKRYSALQFVRVKANTGIPDATFTQQNLSRE
jgi:outer membrane lipoprotein-sorting protein